MASATKEISASTSMKSPEKRGRSHSRGGGRGRSPSRAMSSDGKPRECRFWKSGRCKKGSACTFLHTGKPGAPATSGGSQGGRPGSTGSKGKDGKPKRKSRSNSKGSQVSKGSKGSKGSDRRKGPKPPKVPAAVCILGALIAATSSTQADAAYACRKGSPDSCYDMSSTFSCALPAIRFDDNPMLIGIPPDGNMLPTSVESRKYLKAFGGEPPRPSQQDIKDALTSAKMLRATLDAFGSGIRASCGYECDTEFGCDNCIPKHLEATCVTATKAKSQDFGHRVDCRYRKVHRILFPKMNLDR